LDPHQNSNYIPQAAAEVLRGSDTRLSAQLKKGGFAVGNPVFSIDEQATFVPPPPSPQPPPHTAAVPSLLHRHPVKPHRFAGIMNVVTADILLGHSLVPLSFTQRYRAAKCDTLAPPSDPCDALTDELFSLAGHCWGQNGFDSNACGDNMYSNP
jgi:hypothetical protein